MLEYPLPSVQVVKDYLLLKVADVTKTDFRLGMEEQYFNSFSDLANHVAIRVNHDSEGPILQKYLDKTRSIIEFFFGDDEWTIKDYIDNNNLMAKKLKNATYTNDLSSIVTDLIIE